MVRLLVFSVLKKGVFPFYVGIFLKIRGFEDIGTSFALVIPDGFWVQAYTLSRKT